MDKIRPNIIPVASNVEVGPGASGNSQDLLMALVRLLARCAANELVTASKETPAIKENRRGSLKQ